MLERIEGVHAVQDAALARSVLDALFVLAQAKGSVVRKAYLRLALQTHPDKGGSIECFRQVQEAYERLRETGAGSSAVVFCSRRGSRANSRLWRASGSSSSMIRAARRVFCGARARVPRRERARESE